MTFSAGRAGPRASSADAPPARLYRFVQWELPWELGLVDGRYVMREHAGEEPHHVLVVETRVAPKPGALARRRPRDVAPEPPPPEVSLARVTIVDTRVLDEEAAGAWLGVAAGDDADGTLSSALRLLNTAMSAHRAATADPFVREIAPDDALATRVGYGEGEDVAHGRWIAAKALAGSRKHGSRRERRVAALRPQERLAAVLSGRDVVLACEELTLRARLDLDQGRSREAALQAHIALEAAIAELQAYRELRGFDRRLAELDGHRDTLAAAANEALQGGLSDATIGSVATGLERVEAALRARSASAQY